MALTNTSFLMITQGNILGSTMQPYAAFIGVDNIYTIFLFLAVGIIYARTRSLGLTGIFMMASAALMINFINPAMATYMYGIILLGLAMSIYSAFR